MIEKVVEKDKNNERCDCRDSSLVWERIYGGFHESRFMEKLEWVVAHALR
jgi:hypothetical protein